MGEEPGAGSSPLARGLQDRRRAAAVAAGIIPARAGFTGGSGHRTGSGTDHPRSRGVYCNGLGKLENAGGSSPLARGLRVPIHPDRLERRIIPARAGFTPRRRPCGAGCADHPRSRGVYRLPVEGETPRRGSSPLARGLRSVPTGTPVSPGIIPARAGFTARTWCTGSSGRDHPRSRGVYSLGT